MKYTAPAIVAISAILTACGPVERTVKSGHCPAIHIADTTQTYALPDQSATATLTRATLDCKGFEKSNTLANAITINGTLTANENSQPKKITIPVYLALQRKNGAFAAHLQKNLTLKTPKPNQTTRFEIDIDDFTFDARPNHPSYTYRVIIGFRLSKAQIAQNRNHRLVELGIVKPTIE